MTTATRVETHEHTRTELINIDSLYPHFTPIVAKLGGAARVFTRAELRRFEWHYFRLSPRAGVADRIHAAWSSRVKPPTRRVLRALGILEAVKRLGRSACGLPPLERKLDALR